MECVGKNFILCKLVEVEFTKLMQYTKMKEVLDKLRSIYEGDEKVKKSKLQTLICTI